MPTIIKQKAMNTKQQFKLAYSLLRYNPSEDYHCNDYASRLYDLTRDPRELRTLPLPTTGAAIIAIRNLDIEDRYSFRGKFGCIFHAAKYRAMERMHKYEREQYRKRLANSVSIPKAEYERLKSIESKNTPGT